MNKKERRQRRFDILAGCIAVPGFLDFLLGCFWTHTSWCTYVVRGVPFDWWAPVNIATGLALLVGAAMISALYGK